MEEKRTVPLPADPAEAGRRRTIVIATGAVIAVAVAVVSVVAVSGGSSSPHKPALGAAAATGSSAYATDAGAGGYSQPPGFTYSARPGQPSAPVSTPSSSPLSPPVADPPPSGVNSSQPASNPVPPKTVTKAPASAPGSAAPPPSTSKAPAAYQISGTVSCVSGHSVEGVWVQAAQGSGYSPWQGIGNGSTSRYWYTLPSTMSFSLHVGCGGTTAAWGISLSTPLVPGPVANFTCHDVAGSAGYGDCDVQ
jgi:hypothetical protein